MEVTSRARAEIEAELKRELDLDLPTYDALLHVFEAGEGGIRMSDLATRVLVTRAGMTSMVDRLVERGLAARTADAEDRRVTLVVLTPAGEQLFRQAAGVHNAMVRRTVTEHLTDEQSTAIADALEATPIADATD